MGKIHTIKLIMKEKKTMKCIEKKLNTNNNDHYKITTRLQFHGLGQVHKVCDGVKHVYEYSTLPYPMTLV